MTNEEKAKIILGSNAVERLPQKGNRNVGMYVPVGAHKFSDSFARAVCKFYKGDGSTKGFCEGYMPFHKRDFPNIGALKNPLIQQSLECGIFEVEGNPTPYSVFQFIEGRMLRDVVEAESPRLSEDEAITILDDMFRGVWIPLWVAGLRFRDGHTGNWVLGDDGHAYMIDTEQIRKDAAEFLYNGTSWAQRDRHEKMCLRLVSGIFADLLNACGKGIGDTAAKKILAQTEFLAALSVLGRGSTDTAQAELELKKCISLFFR